MTQSADRGAGLSPQLDPVDQGGAVTSPTADTGRVMRRLLERSSLAMTELWIECPIHGHQAKDPDIGECLACVVYCQSCGYPEKALHHHGQGKGAHPFVAPPPIARSVSAFRCRDCRAEGQ